jgi:hypothetical protein
MITRMTSHRVLLNFMIRPGYWYVSFLEADCQTALARHLVLKSEDKIREMFRRHAAATKLEDEQGMEHGIAIGRGGFWLDLNEEQYQSLRQVKRGR